MTDLKREVEKAEKRIRPHVRETALEYSLPLSREAGCNVYLKLENTQFTGSFKVRGAVNKLLTLTEKERAAGVVAASTGNHGLAVAFGMKRLGIGGTIYLPEDVSARKLGMFSGFDADLRHHGKDCLASERFARAEAERRGAVYISPYNDEQVVAGQGTVGVELMRQAESVDAVFASVGGGGLISGVAGLLKAGGRECRVVGCLPCNSPFMYDSVKAGRIVDSPLLPTLSDGTAGGIEEGAVTFDLCRRLVDDWVLVAEDEIRHAMKYVFDAHGFVIEGAAGVTVAALLKRRDLLPQDKGANIIVVICGGNVDPAKFKELIR